MNYIIILLQSGSKYRKEERVLNFLFLAAGIPK
jgi:hypothetical protein